MSSGTRRALLRGGLLAVALSVAVSAPLLAGSVATIKEVIYVSDTGNKRLLVLEVTWKNTQAAKTKMLQVTTGFTKPTELTMGGGTALVLDGRFARVVDTETHEIVGRVKVGRNARFIDITPDGDYAVASQGKTNVHVIDVAERKVVKKVKSKRIPWRVSISQDGRYAVVANVGNSTITVIDLPILLFRPGATIAPSGSRFVDGVRQLKAGVCQLSGGLDVAAVEGEGVFAMWSCGAALRQPRVPDRPRFRAESDIQEAKISDDTDTTIETMDIPNLGGISDTRYNEDCSVQRAGVAEGPINGRTGTDDPELETPQGKVGQRLFRTFFWNEITGVKKFLADAKMINHFASSAGSRLFLYNPRGVDKGKVGTYVAEGTAEIGGVASSITGTRFVCSS